MADNGCCKSNCDQSYLLKKIPDRLGGLSPVEDVGQSLLLLFVELDPVVVGVDREHRLLAQLEAPVGKRVPDLAKCRRLADGLKDGVNY